MLIGVIVAAVVVVGVVATVLVLRRNQDDEHSVEHYHHQLHTLEGMHGPDPAKNGAAGEAAGATAGESGAPEAAYPASAFRVAGSSTVRLTDLDRPVVPPAPPPTVPNPSEPLMFVDDGVAGADGGGAAVAVPVSIGSGGGGTGERRQAFPRPDDKAMHSIEHTPRRLGAPLAAIGAVTVLIVVLVVTGLHSDASHGRGARTKTTTAPTHAPTTLPPAGHTTSPGTGTDHGDHATTTTSTTAPPAVSAPQATSVHGATYQVASNTYSLSLSAGSGECWVEATTPATGAVVYEGTLLSGQSHIVAATGPLDVIAGAPADFEATVDGVAATMPPDAQSPFTLTFDTPAQVGN